MGPEVEKNQAIRGLFFESQRERVRYDQIIAQLTPFDARIIEAYIDYRDFHIPPWKRGSDRKDIPTFWLRVIRNFKRLENEAEQHRMAKQRMEQDETYQRYLAQEQKKQGKAKQIQGQKQARRVTQSGTPPSEKAAKDYMQWRREQIKAARKQQEDRHQRLLRQQQRRPGRRLRRAQS